MIESDLELVEKQAVAKAWLGKIATEGIMDFASADSLVCDKGLAFGLGDFTLPFILRLDNYSPAVSVAFLNTHSAGNSRIDVRMFTNGDFYCGGITATGSGTGTSIPLSIDLVNGEPYLVFIVFDRSSVVKYMKAYCFSLNSSLSLWGFNGKRAISSSSGLLMDIGDGNTNASNFMVTTYNDGQAWMLPPVNRAMTSEEIHAYVNGIGSPNSLPEDLRGVGSLDEVLTDPENLVTDWTVNNVSITGGQSDSFGGTAANKITASGVPSAQRIYQSATVGGYGEITAIVKTDDGLPFVCFRFSGNETNELCVFFDFAGNFSGTDLNMPDVIKTTSSDLGGGWHKVSILYKAPANTAKTFYVSLTGTDTASNSNLTTLAYAGTSSLLEHALSIKRIGQIFSCRPHRDGIHTDDTGNGYNWSNVDSPVIKPFSAGIR